MSTLRIGLLGGSFDPIHKGHLELAKAILKNGCHEVWLLPCQSSPLKERGLSNFEDRVNMIMSLFSILVMIKQINYINGKTLINVWRWLNLESLNVEKNITVFMI